MAYLPYDTLCPLYLLAYYRILSYRIVIENCIAPRTAEATQRRSECYF